MFARRGFLYKRQNNGAHLAVASQLSPPSPAVPPATSADTAKTSDGINPLTPVAPIQTSNTPTTPSTSTSASSSTPATSSSPSSSSSSSPSSASSSSSGSASATHTTLSTLSTPLTVAASTPVHAPSLSTQLVPGGIAGTLAGIAVLGFLLMWCMRRQRSKDDIDDFDAQAFKRQSAMLVDEPAEPSRSFNPRPPTMIERHNTSPALAAQAGYGGQNFYGGYGGYSQQPPFAPPEMIQSAGSPPPQAYGAQQMAYAGYNDPQQQLARQPSNAQYLTRAPTAPPGSVDPNAQYIDLNRSSISPYQAAQYADISRQWSFTKSIR
ncbi:hypothetical protein OG21DRAFT_796739 [Imleria badia]|nr:hypothetical protein OG21DRAFT_796739 [Imleria badia]